MSLSDRIRERSGGVDPEKPEPTRGAASEPEITQPAEPERPVEGLKRRAQEALFARLGARLYDASLSKDQLHTFVIKELEQVMEEEQVPLTPAERQRIISEISDDVLGYGPLEEFLADPRVTEVMANSDEAIYIERDGKIIRTDARFLSEDQLRRSIEKIVSQIGRRIDESSPMVDARLPDGSRVNAIIPPLAVRGPALTIRKFSKRAFTAEDMIGFGTLTRESVDLLHATVEGRLNVLVSGGTGAGKTSFLNMLSSFIPEDERIVTIEDAVELKMHQAHVVSLESRPSNIEGKGEITIRDLVRNSLRMRPDRIIVGEVRGGEALDMLQAMNTGHEGSLSTLHANSPRDALARLDTMVLMAGMDLPIRAIREQIASALDVVVHMSRLRDGTRRVTHIVEVGGMEGDIITLSDIYLFDFAAGVDNEGRYLGTIKPTGLRPKFTEKLEHAGIKLPPRLFGMGSHEDALRTVPKW
ncbi:MAG TPA: CpaF family protein [Acidimicrobiia bacterium]|nr:CpaF family protein [Acidimicrobiia bacterium]